MSSAAAPAAKPTVDLAAMVPAVTMADHFASMASYAAERTSVEPSVPSFPAPQPLDDEDDPPVWPAWNAHIPPSVHSTACSNMYGNGAHLNHFEAHIANLFGKHAGMFNVTGSMAQLIALKLHAHGRNNIFACHPLSHIVAHNDRSFESLLGFSALTVCPADRVMTAHDVETAVGKHWKQPCALVIELPNREIGGQTVTWEDLKKIRKFTSARGIKMHMDGARIFEIQRFYKRSFQEIASMFDSVYVSFYKGLQGTTGAMLLGEEAFIKEARTWQSRFGGRIYQSFPLSLPAERAFNANVNTMQRRWEKMVEVVAAITQAQRDFITKHQNDTPNVFARIKARAHAEEQLKKKATVASSSTSFSDAADDEAVAAPAAVVPAAAAVADTAPFNPFFYFVPTVPQCSMVHMHMCLPLASAAAMRASIIEAGGASFYDWSRPTSDRACVFEFKMGTANAQIDTQVFVDTWNEFMNRRYEQLKVELQE